MSQIKPSAKKSAVPVTLNDFGDLKRALGKAAKEAAVRRAVPSTTLAAFDDLLHENGIDSGTLLTSASDTAYLAWTEKKAKAAKAPKAKEPAKGGKKPSATNPKPAARSAVSTPSSGSGAPALSVRWSTAGTWSTTAGSAQTIRWRSTR